MSRLILDSLLDALAETKDREATWAILNRNQDELLRRPETGAELAVRVGATQHGDDDTPELLALESLMTGARMNRENRGGLGGPFLAAVDGAIARLAAEGGIVSTGAFALSRCYLRAGLQPPQPLLDTSGLEAPTDEMPDLDELLDSMRQEAGGDVYSLHAGLSEMLAALPAQVRQAVTDAIVMRGDAVFDHLGCYWLLDPAADVRAAAAGAFLRRVQAGRLDAATASRLIGLRGWLPDDAARDVVDRVVKEALRREVTGGAETAPWKLHRIIGSIPDGAGAQTIAIVAQSGGRRRIVMLLLKQGFGVKDAYAIPFDSASEQKRALSEIARQVEMVDLSPDFLAPAIAASLAEGLGQDAPPAHGLLDAVEICGLTGLRPQPMGVSEWISNLDPEGTLAQLSPQRLGRLINASRDWPETHSLASSWYEDGAAVEQLMATAITRRSREQALWRHLETRRDWWALVLAKTAATLKARVDGPRENWEAFAATAMALANDRPLRKVPLMNRIVERSVEIAESSWVRRSGAGDSWPAAPDLDDLPVEFLAPAAEKKGELKRLLKSVGMTITPDWLDGYLIAVAVAPKMIKPGDWIGGLLALAGNFPDETQLQRFLDLALHRYNAANADAAGADVMRGNLTRLSAAAFHDWAQGFHTSVTAYKRHWGGRGVNTDDKAALRLVADVANGRAGAGELLSLLPTWLQRRHDVRS